MVRSYIAELECGRCKELKETVTFKQIMDERDQHICIRSHEALCSSVYGKMLMDYILKRVQEDKRILLDVIKKLYGDTVLSFIQNGYYMESWYLTDVLMNQSWRVENGLLLFYASLITNTKLLHNMSQATKTMVEAEKYTNEVLPHPSAHSVDVENISLPSDDVNGITLNALNLREDPDDTSFPPELEMGAYSPLPAPVSVHDFSDLIEFPEDSAATQNPPPLAQ